MCTIFPTFIRPMNKIVYVNKQNSPMFSFHTANIISYFANKVSSAV